MSDSDPKEVIRVEDLECRYGDKLILQGVTFSIHGQEIVFIAGRSGCGKSTLLRHLLGLLTPSRGRIAYFGKTLAANQLLEREELLRTFGVLFQEDALWTDMSLLENVCLPLVLHTNLPRQIREEIGLLKLAQVGLAGYQDRFPSELSGGMQKRAALARALALDPAVLFFDEPTAGQDPITVRQIDHLILQVRDTVGTTIVVVSHSIPSIWRLADRVILLDQDHKGIVAVGTPAELASWNDPPVVREFFESDNGKARSGSKLRNN